ncbi:hypothetical protein [uncultured Agrobacterium sp.]|uniref:hypothetical protein n=1 Tax=uncultured Agrobacterium sp. TaxID=157277 RepID=UPI0025DC2F86|nr:hypothetical protein [uncultured Agrobacterium sp.]
MSSIVMHARDLVQALKGEAYCLEDRDLDERDMRRQQLEKLAAGFGRVAEIAAQHEKRIREDIQHRESDVRPRFSHVIEDVRRISASRLSGQI